jgi:hypothetical protein
MSRNEHYGWCPQSDPGCPHTRCDCVSHDPRYVSHTGQIVVDLSTREGVLHGLRTAASQIQHEYPVSHASILAAIELLESGR